MSPIALFDSGVGGLTVFREIARLLPFEDLIYLGDTARLPYGTKSAETILRYSRECADFLSAEGAKLLVIACHTVSSLALEDLQQKLSIPVLGMLQPGVELVQEAGLSKVAILATESTLASHAHQNLILQSCPGIELHTVACPLFVPLAEEGLHQHALAQDAARHYLGQLRSASVQGALLACTHYPLLRCAIQAALGPTTKLLEPATRCAQNVQRCLDMHNLSESKERTATYRFYTTDHPERFAHLAALFLGQPCTQIGRVKKLELNRNLNYS